jgi:signal transduction histidine kinase
MGGGGQMPPAGAAPTVRRFVAVAVGIAACFIAVTAYSQSVQRNIDRDADDIAYNAAPSVERLSAARAELRHLEALLAPTRVNANFAAIGRSRAVFHDDIAEYLALPTFPGERERWDAVSAVLERFEQVVSGVLAGESSARAQLPATVDLASEAIAGSIEFNAAQARRLAIDIRMLRRRSLITGYLLDGLAAALALAASLFLLRGVRQYTDLLEAYGSLARDRAEELEQFSGRVAHDILSPLATASMALGIAGAAAGADERARTTAMRGMKSLQRVQLIVNGLLDFARAGARPAPGVSVELKSVIDDVTGALGIAAREKQIELAVEPSLPCAVACSAGVLTSLMANLVNNAIKYMGDDGAERRITVRLRDLGQMARVEVADTGPGIPRELLPTLFEPYVRGATEGKPGIGLGLATVKRIAESHGGRAGVESALGEGSCFWFELPKVARRSTDQKSVARATST